MVARPLKNFHPPQLSFTFGDENQYVGSPRQYKHLEGAVEAVGAVGAALLGFSLLNLLSGFRKLLPLPKLENDPFCGITTGGQVR